MSQLYIFMQTKIVANFDLSMTKIVIEKGIHQKLEIKKKIISVLIGCIVLVSTALGYTLTIYTESGTTVKEIEEYLVRFDQ